MATSLVVAELPAKDLLQGIAHAVWLFVVAVVWLSRLGAELPMAARTLGSQDRWWALSGVVLAWIAYAAVIFLALGAAQAHLNFMHYVPALERFSETLDNLSLPFQGSLAWSRALWWAAVSAGVALVAEILRWASWLPSRLQAERNAQALLERLQQDAEPQPQGRSIVRYR